MVTAIDTSVLLDVINANRNPFSNASEEAIRRAMGESQLVVSDVVWAELAYSYQSSEELSAPLCLR